jgi:gluconolactonase
MSFDPLVDRGEVELIDDGYGWSEGPQRMSDAGVLLFTDANADAIYQVGPGDEVTVYRQPSGYANGLAVDGQGRLLAAEQRSRSVTRAERDGTVTPVAADFEGVRLNRPNDIAVRSDGTIYFTDPLFADFEHELDFRGVFRIAPDGSLTAERKGATTEAPNGVVTR